MFVLDVPFAVDDRPDFQIGVKGGNALRRLFDEFFSWNDDQTPPVFILCQLICQCQNFDGFSGTGRLDAGDATGFLPGG
jgi:hypothetical protein